MQPARKPSAVTLADFNLATAERALCQAAIRRAGGLRGAARLLGVSERVLRRLVVKHKILVSTDFLVV